MSTDLMTYQAFMGNWDSESDANIDAIIAERNLFLKIGDVDSDKAVNKEFDELTKLAKEVRDLTIAEDAADFAAQGAAVSAIWSFGWGMAAFAAAETAKIIAEKKVSKKSDELNNKLASMDTDIANGMDENMAMYMAKFKANNNLIASKSITGMGRDEARALLFQFMAEVYKKANKLDATTFRKYAEVCRKTYNIPEMQDVYDALDTLALSDQTPDDIQQYMNTLVGLKLPVGVEMGEAFLQSVTFTLMSYKLKIANDKIEKAAKAARNAEGEPMENVEEAVSESAFKVMDTVGKVAACSFVASAVIQGVFDIWDVVDVCKQCNDMCDKINNDKDGFRKSYSDYFKGMKEASLQYQKVINDPS